MDPYKKLAERARVEFGVEANTFIAMCGRMDDLINTSTGLRILWQKAERDNDAATMNELDAQLSKLSNERQQLFAALTAHPIADRLEHRTKTRKAN